MMIISRKIMRHANKDSPKPLDHPDYEPVKTHLLNFVNENVVQLPLDVRRGWTQLRRRPASVICLEIVVAMKKHVFYLFGDCPKYLKCLLEEELLEHRNVPNFKELILCASSILYTSCVSGTEHGARTRIQRFCAKNSVPAWEASIITLMVYYREFFSQFRRSRSYQNRLAVLSQLRHCVAHLQQREEDTWPEIDAEQPKLVVEKKKSWFLCGIVRS